MLKFWIFLLPLFWSPSLWAAEKILRLTTNEKLRSYHPYFGGESNALVYFYSYPLVSLDEKWQWQCMLCKRLPTFENTLIKTHEDDKGKIFFDVTIELVPSWTWGDGHPITVDDLVLSWQIAQKIENESKGDSLFKSIVDIQRSSDIRVAVLRFKKPWDLVYRQLSNFFLLPAHLEKAIWDKSKNLNEYFENSHYTKNPQHPGLANGPFLPAKAELVDLRFIRNTKSQVAAKVDVLEVFSVDKPKMLSTLLEGKTDIVAEMESTGAFPWESVQNQQAFKILSSDNHTYEHIAFNLRNPLFRDVAIRQALLMSINKEKIYAQLMHDQVIPAVSSIHPQSEYFHPLVHFYPYDLSKAKALLDSRGWLLSKDGYRYKGGNKLSLSVISLNDPERARLLKFLKESWQGLGVELSAIFYDSKEAFSNHLQRGKYSGLALMSWSIHPFSNQSSMLNSNSIPNIKNNYSGQNIMFWANSIVDDVYNKLASTYETSKQKKLLAKLQIEYVKDIPAIPLFFRNKVAVFSSRVSGFRFFGEPNAYSLSAKDWSIQP